MVYHSKVMILESFFKKKKKRENLIFKKLHLVFTKTRYYFYLFNFDKFFKKQFIYFIFLFIFKI